MNNDKPLSGPWPRIAGVLYLITILAGVFAEIFVRSAVIVRDDAGATAANILASEFWYRLGVVADLVMLISYVGVTWLFYYLFKPVSERVALLAVLFSMVGIAVLAVNSVNHLLPLVVLGGNSYLTAFESAELNALARVSLRLHNALYLVSIVFFGFYCILIGWLGFRSGFIPRIVGFLMALGGVSFLTSSFLTLLFPMVSARLPDISMFGGIGELTLALWLIVKGGGWARMKELETSNGK